MHAFLSILLGAMVWTTSDDVKRGDLYCAPSIVETGSSDSLVLKPSALLHAEIANPKTGFQIEKTLTATDFDHGTFNGRIRVRIVGNYMDPDTVHNSLAGKYLLHLNYGFEAMGQDGQYSSIEAGYSVGSVYEPLFTAITSNQAYVHEFGGSCVYFAAAARVDSQAALEFFESR